MDDLNEGYIYLEVKWIYVEINNKLESTIYITQFNRDPNLLLL